MNKLFWIFLVVGLGPTLLLAQIKITPSIIASSGAYGQNENFSISWTMGEIAITTLHGENMILTQGFQQPLDFGVGINASEINWNISVYPNPVQNELNILFDLQESKDFLIELHDVTGRVLTQKTRENVNPGDLVILNISGFVSGVYFLRILTKDFQLVKVISLRKI